MEEVSASPETLKEFARNNGDFSSLEGLQLLKLYPVSAIKKLIAWRSDMNKQLGCAYNAAREQGDRSLTIKIWNSLWG